MLATVLLDKVREHWFSVTLYAVFSAFFLVAGILSALTYSAVVQAHNQIHLAAPSSDATLLEDGSLEIRFEITLSNPTDYRLQINSASWTVYLDNSTAQGGTRLTLDIDYIGPTVGLRVDAGDELPFVYQTVVSDPSLLESLRGFVNYSASVGTTYTLETIPYVNEVVVLAWIGDFEHDYIREDYLNDLVRVEERYSSEAVP